MKSLTIAAECHTDDYAIEVRFNAVNWFKQASDQEIIELAECAWRGDYPADKVAEESIRYFKKLESIFSHTNQCEDLSGFECSVDEVSAMAWLKANRIDLFEVISGANEIKVYENEAFQTRVRGSNADEYAIYRANTSEPKSYDEWLGA